MIEAATDIAVSKSSGETHTDEESSTTTVAWLRLVSRYWRTSRAPSPPTPIAFAEDLQWMCRRSSPGAYSRSAWKARSLCDRASVDTPSRSRSSPAPNASSGTIGGRTMISVTPVHSTSRELSPSGSPRRVITGPTGITPRRSVRMVRFSSLEAPSASVGTAYRCNTGPTGTSSTVGSSRRRARLVTVMLAATESPATTRSGCSRRSTRTVVRPTRNGRASATSSRQAADSTATSRHWARDATRARSTPRPRTTHPIGLTTVSTAPTRRAIIRLTPPGRSVGTRSRAAGR